MSGGKRLARLALPVGIAAVFVAHYSWTRPTNFAGPDEWLCIDLASRGILWTPYADRPLDLLWTAIPARILPHELGAYWLFHGLYLLGAGLLASWLARRIARGGRLVALVAGVAAVAWAPLDFMRLDAVLLSRYSGATFVVLAAAALFLESWRTGRVWALALGAGLAFLAALGFEGVLALLALVPALPLALRLPPPRRALARALAWEATVVLAAALTTPGALLTGDTRYQASGLGFDPQPVRVAWRLARLLGLQLHPLFTSPAAELAVPAVALATAVFVVAGVAVVRFEPRVGDASLAALLRLALVGASIQLLGTLPFAFSPATQNAGRTQVLAAPGVGLLLAAGAGLLPRLVAGPRRAALLVGLAGAWVVAVGTGRVAAMQRDWDSGGSAYAEHHRTLSGLVAQAPGLRPDTLVLLLDEAGAWPLGFSFRHAVSYLYDGEAVGLVLGANDVLYPYRVGPEGVLVLPYESIRAAWQAPPARYSWSQVVVARLPPAGALEIVEHWPAAVLPAPTPGARYDPRARILHGVSGPASRSILSTPPPGGLP